MATQGAKDSYVVNGEHHSPCASQEWGNHELTLKRYPDPATELDNNTSSVVGLPNVLGGANINTLFPKAWDGAEGIYMLGNISGASLDPKIGSGAMTIDGSPSVDDLSTVEIFDDDPFAFAGDSSYNYLFNKGNVVNHGTTANNPKVGNTAQFNGSGKGGRVASNATTVALDKDWERIVKFKPTTITPGAEVFIIAKGYGSSANCQFAISYDDTSIYRTIGGTKVAVGATSTYFDVNKEVRLSIINMGAQTTAKDSFAINDTIVRDNLSTDRGSVTSVRQESIGGIPTTDDDVSALTSQALGNYRMYIQYNDEHVSNYLDVADQQIADYVNYTASILIGGSGDSIMNGSGEGASDRSTSFFFQIESWLKSLGYDVLFANQGISGTTYQAHRPSHLPYPASINEDPSVKNINYANVTRMCKEFKVDILIGNSGTNEYANQNEPVLPYDWYSQLVAMAQISSECARYGVKYIHNTTGAHKNPNTDYERDVSINVNNHLLQRSLNVINWRDYAVDTATGLATDQMYFDDVHPTLRLASIIARAHRPHLLALVESSKLAYPETV